eukprot:Selendium_serpulae@DN557_c0_g1_i1.p1
MSRGTSNVFNLLMVDIASISNLIMTFLDLYLFPIRLGIALAVLAVQVSGACAPGIAVILVCASVMVVTELLSARLKDTYMHWRDVRLQRCHETLSEMRALKMVGWEHLAAERVAAFRTKEMEKRRSRMYLTSISGWISESTQICTEVAIFASYSFWYLQSSSGEPFRMKASIAIPTIYLLGHMMGPVTSFPFIMNAVIEGYISLMRFEKYLCVQKRRGSSDSQAGSQGNSQMPSPRISHRNIPCTETTTLLGGAKPLLPCADNDLIVSIENGTFTWSPTAKLEELEPHPQNDVAE